MGWESNSIFQVLIVTGSTGSGVFVYSPSPGAGNLVASIAATSGTDPYGNVYQSGFTSYVNSGGTFFAVDMFQNIIQWLSAPSEAGPWTGGPQIQWSQVQGLLNHGPPGAPTFSVADNVNAVVNISALPLAIGSSGGLRATFSADATGYPTVTDNAGPLTLNLSGCQPASGNKLTVTTATFGSLGFGTIPASDAEANAVYEFECGGYGTNAAVALTALTLQARFGASPGAATDVVGTGFTANPGNAVGDAFQWSAKVRAQCLTSGGAATWRIWLTGSITDTVTNFSVPFAVGTGPTDVTLSSAAAINMGLSAEWASVTNAPTITKSGHQFGRRA